MLKQNIFTLILIIFTFSCAEKKSNKATNESNKSSIQSDSEFQEISAFDNENEVRAKFKKTAELDDADFKETQLYDDFFKDKITKFSISQKNSDKKTLSAVVYKDTLRYTKMHMYHVGKQTFEEALKNNKKIENKLLKSVEQGVYTKTDNKFLTGNVNSEKWYLTMFVSQYKLDGRQDYWTLSAPETEFDYLKFMANNFKSQGDVLIKFLIN